MGKADSGFGKDKEKGIGKEITQRKRNNESNNRRGILY